VGDNQKTPASGNVRSCSAGCRELPHFPFRSYADLFDTLRLASLLLLAAFSAAPIPRCGKTDRHARLRRRHERAVVGHGGHRGPITVSWQPEGQAMERQLTLEATAASGNVVLARLTGSFPARQSHIA
jgi:hypothetical protein